MTNSGLLRGVSEGRAAFYHPSFQEFFAAQWIDDVETDLLEVFQKRADTAEWRNTLSLLFGRLVGARTITSKAEDLLDRFVGGVTTAAVGAQIVAANCLEICPNATARERGSRKPV